MGEVAFKSVTVIIGVGLDHNDFPNVSIDEVTAPIVIGSNFEIGGSTGWAGCVVGSSRAGLLSAVDKELRRCKISSGWPGICEDIIGAMTNASISLISAIVAPCPSL